MRGIKRPVFLKCVSVVLALAVVAVARPTGQKHGFSSVAALEKALAELGLEPNEVSAGSLELDDVTAGEKEISAGLRLTGSGLGQALRWLEETALRLDGMSGPADFLGCKFVEKAVADTVGLQLQESTVLTASRMGEAALAPAHLRQSLENIIPGAGGALDDFLAADSLIQRAFDNLTPAESEELVGLIQGFRPEDDQWPGYPVERMLSLIGRVDTESLKLAGLIAARGVATLRRALERWERPTDSGPGDEDFSLPFSLDTPRGAVVIGGVGADHYTGSVWLVIEPGGDDTYELGRVEQEISVIVDFEGKDSYRAADNFSLGGALGGLSWVEDISGDDKYDAGNYSMSMGAAALGVGVLVDREGSDRYSGTAFCQGAALFGLGLLLDLSGNDSYQVSFCGQGAVVGSGVGILADLGGSDSYHAGGVVPDWREPGATKSWAQGSALGLRPFAGGGLALLYDREGNDSYSVDYFGQGAGYWEGVGLLIDRGGDDVYRAGRYAQGCGLHRSAGMLADSGGDDSYEIAAVGQGVGEDRALGVLLESTGCDTYRAGWMARGAGGSGGVGLLLEIVGDDSYFQGRKGVDGFGSRWRELSGLGFLIDCAGKDNYGAFSQKAEIRRSGTWGAALDLPLESESH